MSLPGVPPLTGTSTISPRLTHNVSRAVGPLLLHSYRKSRPQPVLDQGGLPVLDEWNQPTFEPGPIVGPLRCLYEARSRQVVDSSGRRVIVEPTLWIDNSDDLQPGDQVEDVTDRSGHVLLASATIDTVDPLAEPGGLVLGSAVLRDVVVVGDVPTAPEAP